MKICIIFHRVDWDGFTSAAVALRAFPYADLIGWSYGDVEPDVSEYVRVILVDLSMSEAWMDANADKLLWIDHHWAADSRLMLNQNISTIEGIRRDGIGACALTWEWFFPKEQMPLHVRLAATADVMDTTLQLAPLKVALSYGLYLDTFGPGRTKEEGDRTKKLIKEATRLFDDFDALEGLCEGAGLEQKRAEHETELFTNARYTTIDGHSAVVLNIDKRPNACILSHLLDNTHDVFVCIGEFIEDKGKYKVSLRVPERSDFNANAFCMLYGGGGHIKASGCLMTKEEINAL